MSNIKVYAGKSPVKVVFSRFPAGETMVKVNGNWDDTNVNKRGNLPICLELKYTSNSDLFDLALVVDALRRYYVAELDIVLVMDYLPYARQDRVCNKGESLSVKVVADFINSLNFIKVFCKDIHSEVGVALINNLVHTEQHICANSLQNVFTNKGNTVIVSPDAGANKKVFKFAQTWGYPSVVRADKIRNLATGEITETKVYSEHVGSRDFLIIDDICDGGRTFIELAKELRKLTDGKIYLYVTHGIFSKGAEVFEGVLDGIYTSNLMGEKHNLITEV